MEPVQSGPSVSIFNNPKQRSLSHPPIVWRGHVALSDGLSANRLAALHSPKMLDAWQWLGEISPNTPRISKNLVRSSTCCLMWASLRRNFIYKQLNLQTQMLYMRLISQMFPTHVELHLEHLPMEHSTLADEWSAIVTIH